MKVKILRNLGSPKIHPSIPTDKDGKPFKENQVVDLPDAEAEPLIKQGLAEAYDDKREKQLKQEKSEMRDRIRAVPPPATVMTGHVAAPAAPDTFQNNPHK